MTEKIRIADGKIKWVDATDFKDIYSFVYTLLTDFNYFVMETQYIDRTKPTGKEIQIFWTARKKISDYFRISIGIEWFAPDVKDVEVVKDGVKLKLNKGSFEFKYKIDLEKDYMNKWQAGFKKGIRKIYDNFIIADRIRKYKDYYNEELNEIVETIKAYLSLSGIKSPVYEPYY